MSPLGRLFVAVALISGGYDAVRVTVSYRVLALGGDAATVGIVAGTFAVLPMLLALRFGRLVDRRGAKGVYLAGIALSAVAVAGLAVTPTISVLAAIYTVLGLGQIMTLIGAQGFVMELTERSRHVNGFATFTLAVSLGQSIGTPAVGLLLGAGPRSAAVATTVPLLIMAAVMLAALPFAASLPARGAGVGAGAGVGGGVGADGGARGAGDGNRGAVTGARAGTPVGALLRRPGLVPSIYAAMVVVSGVDLITVYMPVIGHSLGLSPFVVTLLVSVRSGLSMVSRTLLPWILRGVQQRFLLMVCPVVTVPAAIVLGTTGEPVVLTLALAVIGVVWGLNQPVSMNWVTAAAPTADRSAALSLRLTGNRAAQVLLPLGAGAIAGLAGPGSVFLLIGAVSAVSAVSTTLSLNKTPFAELGGTARTGRRARTRDPRSR